MVAFQGTVYLKPWAATTATVKTVSWCLGIEVFCLSLVFGSKSSHLTDTPRADWDLTAASILSTSCDIWRTFMGTCAAPAAQGRKDVHGSPTGTRCSVIDPTQAIFPNSESPTPANVRGGNLAARSSANLPAGRLGLLPHMLCIFNHLSTQSPDQMLEG